MPGQVRGGSFKHESYRVWASLLCYIEKVQRWTTNHVIKTWSPLWCERCQASKHESPPMQLCSGKGSLWQLSCHFLTQCGPLGPVQELQAPAAHMTINFARTFCVCAPPAKSPAYRYACVKHAKNKVELYQQIKANDAFSRNDVQSESLDPLGRVFKAMSILPR